MEVTVEFMDSQRAHRLFVVNGFKFRVHRELKDGVLRCACTKKTCKAYLKLSSSYKVVESSINHNHEKPASRVLSRQRLSNTLKRKAVEDISCRPSNLIRRELLENGYVHTLTLKDKGLIRYNLLRARSAVHLKLPPGQQETHNHIKLRTVTTNREEQFLMNSDIGLAPSPSVMDASVQVSIKEEITSKTDNHYSEELKMDNHYSGELIIPDFVPSEDIDSPNEDFKTVKDVKSEPLEKPIFMDADDNLENPYQCFECELDCKSQGELIDHYEKTHSEENSHKSDDKGNSCLGAEGTDDPLAGDMAPDSPKKTANVEGAQNDATPHEVLLLYSCPCCGHSDTDWNRLIKHMEKHAQVTCLSCSNCRHVFSSSYPLKDYTGKDPGDEPHVCSHCPFRTQWYQLLKDHCVMHHKNTAPLHSSFHNNQNSIPSNGSVPIKNATPPTQPLHTAFETFNSHSLSCVPTLAVPYSGSQAGCFVVVSSSIPGQQDVVNVAVPVSNAIPGIHNVQTVPNNVSVIPQVLKLNHMNPLLAPAVQQGVNGSDASMISLTHHPGGIYSGRANPPSSLPNQEPLPSLVPKLENPVESNRAGAAPSLPPKSANRSAPSKVPVDELLKKWDFPNIAPHPILPKSANSTVPPKIPVNELLKKWDTPNVNHKPPMPVVHPNPSILLTDMPPCRAPRGSLDKSRKGIKTKPCPYCSHVARDSHSLKTHIFVHTKEKPFKCEICDYRATQRAHIQKHLATHINSNRRGKHHRAEEVKIER